MDSNPSIHSGGQRSRGRLYPAYPVQDSMIVIDFALYLVISVSIACNVFIDG